MRTLIVYGSHHHGSTKKLVEAIGEKYPVDLLDAEMPGDADLNGYDLIGFASGIDFGKFYPAVTEMSDTLPEGKQVFALYTCAKDNDRYGREILQTAAARNGVFLGKFGCRGYNTYGPWKLIGGMNKGHPNEEEKEGAVRFYERLLEKTMENNG